MPTKTKAPVKRTKRTKKEVSSDTPVAPAATTTVAPVASKVAEEASDVVPYQHVIDQLHEQTAWLLCLVAWAHLSMPQQVFSLTTSNCCCWLW